MINMFFYLIIIQLLNFFIPPPMIAQETPLETINTQEISFFRKSPRLARAMTTYRSPRAESYYIFEIDIPAEAESSLKKVIIEQQKNVETIRIFPQKTKALIITKKEEEIPIIATLDLNNNQNQLTINFTQPIPAGNKIRLKIRAINPLYGGIYQFGVTVFPEGNNPRSLYLGIGRLQFDQPGGRF
jgi:hypothetical protein